MIFRGWDSKFHVSYYLNLSTLKKWKSCWRNSQSPQSSAHFKDALWHSRCPLQPFFLVASIVNDFFANWRSFWNRYSFNAVTMISEFLSSFYWIRKRLNPTMTNLVYDTLLYAETMRQLLAEFLPMIDLFVQLVVSSIH